ncbi:hypothetical protein EON79_21815, partial [bacterium]
MMLSIRTAFRKLDTRPIEGLYCLLTMAWGISLLWPGDGFATSPNFQPMAWIAPDWAWGTLAVTVGVFRAVGLTFRLVWARLFAALGGGAVWS